MGSCKLSHCLKTMDSVERKPRTAVCDILNRMKLRAQHPTMYWGAGCCGPQLVINPSCPLCLCVAQVFSLF